MSLCKRLLLDIQKQYVHRWFISPSYKVTTIHKLWLPKIIEGDAGINIGILNTGDPTVVKVRSVNRHEFDTEQEADKFIKKLESDQCDKCGDIGKCKEIPKRFFTPYKN